MESGPEQDDDLVTTLVQGSCGDHLVALDSWHDGTVFMSLWSPISSHTWGRFHWVWQSLRGRWNGNSEIALNREDTEDLIVALAEHLDRTAKIL